MAGVIETEFAELFNEFIILSDLIILELNSF